MNKVAFIGLGAMGGPMAGHLLGRGWTLGVYNRGLQRREQWRAEHKIAVCESLADAVVDAEVVLLCLGADPDIESVVCGPGGVLDNLAEAAVVVDHSTSSAELAESLAAKVIDKGGSFIDAPVSGGESGAIAGTLTVMAGGEVEAWERVGEVLDCYSAFRSLLGPAGSGQRCKMVNQVCIAGLLQGLAEGLQFCANAGLDANKVFEVISKGAAGSWQMQNRWPTMVEGEYNFGFAVDWMRKDLSYVLAEARRNGSQLPVTALVDQFYAEIQQRGGGRWDTSSLLTRMYGEARGSDYEH